MSKTKIGLSENITGVLAYLLGWITGIILLIIEKENKFVRFHAAQSTVLSVGLIVLNIVLGLLDGIPIIGFLFGILSALIGLLGLVLWIYLMFKAFKGDMYRLPIIAEYADKLEAAL
jgi:uncharacterized membrane protein